MTRRTARACAALAAAFLTSTPLWAESATTAPEDRLVVVASVEAADGIAGAADLLSLEDLRRQSYVDIHRALRAVPGVNIQEEDGFGLRPNIGFRGTGLDRSSKITLMEDGILIAPAPYADPSAYYFPHVGRMAGVEITKGPGTIKYGPRTQGGSLNFTSMPVPDARSGRIELSGGSFGTLRGQGIIGGPVGSAGPVAVSVLGQAFIDSTDGFKELDGGGDTGYFIEDYVGKIRFESQPGAPVDQSLTIKVQYSDEQSDETYLGLTDADFEADPFRRYRASQDDLMDAEHSEVSARWFAAFDNGLDLGLVAYRTDFARDWFKLDRIDPAGTLTNSGRSGTSISAILDDPVANADAVEIIVGERDFVSADGAVILKHNNREYYAQGVQAIVGYETGFAGLRHDIEASLRWHEDEVDRFQWYERFRMDRGQLVRTGRDTPGTESNRIDSAQALAGYIQNTITTDRWTIVPGVRVEQIDLEREDFGRADPERTGVNRTRRDNSVTVVIPGISALYKVTPDWSAFAGVHRGFAPPSPGASDADAEDAVNWEAGMRYRKGATHLEAIGFYSDYTNILGTCTASTGGGCDIGDQFDGGEVDVLGLELTGGLNIAAWLDLPVALPARIAYTYTSAEFGTSFESAFDPWGTVQDGDRLPYIPEHQIFAALGVEGAWWGGEVALSYVDEVRTEAGQGPIPANRLIEARTVLDLSAYADVADGVRLTASVRNLLDNDYAVARRPAGLRPGLPRLVLVGASVDF